MPSPKALTRPSDSIGLSIGGKVLCSLALPGSLPSLPGFVFAGGFLGCLRRRDKEGEGNSR